LPGWPFLGQNFSNLALFEVGWLKIFLLASSWLALKISFGLLALFWHFYAEKVSSEGKYYHSVLIGNKFAKYL